MHLGIDFGSKLAGTTVICYVEKNQFVLKQSEKKKDADLFLLENIEFLPVKQVFIDAPLSLPKAYFNKGEDFMFRAADREVQAMSPMFLGGLTARAMRLQKILQRLNISCFEAYPKQTALNYFPNLHHLYKQRKMEMTYSKSMHLLPFQFTDSPKNWHQIDAVLAWYAGYRYLSNTGHNYGCADEGIILA